MRDKAQCDFSYSGKTRDLCATRYCSYSILLSGLKTAFRQEEERNTGAAAAGNAYRSAQTYGSTASQPIV
jgi:hypothetical protein